MAVDSKLRQLAAGICLAALTGSGYAAEKPIDLTLPASGFYTQDAPSFMLAGNDTGLNKPESSATPATQTSEFESRMFSGRKIHQYLGISTVTLAAMTFTTHMHTNGFGPRDVNGVHGELGKATGAMALATVASGLISHWDDFSLEDGWSDPDNLHVLLASTGAALMAYAIYNSASQTTGRVDHSGMAELGALGMVIAIKLTW